jgi:threonine dehydratase
VVTYELILQAAERLRGRVRRTELMLSHYFSDKLGFPLFFKCENLQRTGSFKIRGALNFMMSQPPGALSPGVTAVSAGNHAQGVAFAARLLGVPASIYMPENTSLQKILATREYGANVVLTGATFDDACAAALQAREKNGAVFVHPFEDPLIMAGQGTIGLEIVEDLPDAGTVVVPVGGGGLIAGIATAVKALRPDARIVGVESECAPSMHYSLRKGSIVDAPVTLGLADGIAVSHIGRNAFPTVRELVDDVVLVSEEETAAAMVALLDKGKLLVEGAGAVPLAAVMNGRVPGLGEKTVCVISGGNVDVKTISMVVERGLLAAGRYLKLKVELSDIPGSLARLAQDVADTAANIFFISHDRKSIALPLGRTEVLLELETKGYDHIKEVIRYLEERGYAPEVLR